VSSRLDDLRDLAEMLDEGKITQKEYDVVKAELLDAPAEEWGLPEQPALEPEPEPDPDSPEGWRALLAEFPPIYRLAAVGAGLVLVAGVVLAATSDTAGSVRADPSSIRAAAPAGPSTDSLGLLLTDLVGRWNEVGDPPTINGSIMTSPEPGRLDSFLYRFEGNAVLAGAYDPADGSVHALMARASLHDEAASGLFIHLCHVLQAGSQACLDAYVEVTGTFGKPHSELAGTQVELGWDLGGQAWELQIADDVETIRVQPSSASVGLN
jgi:hypothetical protein